MRRLRYVVAAACLLTAGCGGEPEIDRLHREHGRLRAELARVLARDQVVSDVQQDGGLIIVAVRAAYLGELIREVAARYFDRVELDLTPDLRVHHEEEVNRKTIVGTLKGGRWTVDVTIERISGTLRGGAPRFSVSRENRLDLVVPVALQGAEGQARVQFTWNANLLASVICRDFQVDERIRGRVLPQSYEVHGAFTFEARPGALVARPEFRSERFRLRIDLAQESWDRIRRALEAQDRPSKCGLALDPQALMTKLEALGRKGFEVRLPRSLLHDITLPASVSGSATVEGREIALTVEPRAFRVTRDHTWYSVAVKTAVRRAEGEADVAPHLSDH
jgi:hypothetical protein